MSAPGGLVRMLSNGLEATLRPDEHGLVLLIDGIEQSHLGVPGAPPRHVPHRWMLVADGALVSTYLGASSLPPSLMERIDD